MIPPNLTGLTDEELVEAVATQVMGWKKEPGDMEWVSEDGGHWMVNHWNPVSGSWDDTMEVVHYMRDHSLSYKFADTLVSLFCSSRGVPTLNDPFDGASIALVQASQREICLAALTAISSPPSHARSPQAS
jgi:hypothetical protein